ncbi:MAG: hypothetical protein A2073_08585 [Deltaproteobacteria bacterium GWC2_42_11]|nr:MAG: hypothetical protein A2073_08585 [Deltaproteobacteria bacterium GWC2_42_11]HBO83488.1 hypothetical protein [Deltaproteobacteria bacterium]
MSSFLGPIHYWLFSKIKLVEDRENAIIKVFSEKFGDDVNTIAKDARAKYGEPVGDTSLDQMIGDSPIHGFLNGRITAAETRESYVLSELIKKYGTDANSLAMDTAYNHGLETGKRALKEYEIEDVNPESAYRALQNFFLDGMPCDHVTEVDQPSEKALHGRHTDCLHKPYWDEAGIAGSFMCEYLAKWVDGFIAGLGSSVKYKRIKSIIKGDTHCEDVFEKA